MTEKEMEMIKAMYKEMEIMKAMNTVKEYCDNRESCTEPSRCPLYCYCEDNPCHWPSLDI